MTPLEKTVSVIASGPTEVAALPVLLQKLVPGCRLDMRQTPHGQVTPRIASRLIRAAWYEGVGRGDPPDKIVVLADADGAPEEDFLGGYQELHESLGSMVKCPIFFCAVSWCLETWFFADEQGMRSYIGGSLGDIRLDDPDRFQRPKLHLRHILDARAGRLYTRHVAGEIAQTLDARVIEKRSGSFTRFVHAVRNGPSSSRPKSL